MWRAHDKPLLNQVGHNALGIFFGGTGDCVGGDFSILRRLVWIVYSGKTNEAPLARQSAHSFRIGRLANLQRRADKNFNKAFISDHGPAFIASGTVRTD